MPTPDLDIQLITAPLNPATLIAFVTVPEAGGIDLFIGTTRAENHPTLGQLQHLDYAAYNEMAVKELTKLGQQAKEKWSTTKIALHHRLGPVPIGEASIIIAVSCPHRADAFSACRYLIDSLKETVPIWKKEVYTGSVRWQAES